MSAASRPVAIRTNPAAARAGGVDHHPLAVDDGLGDGVKVHRIAARCIHGDGAGGNVERRRRRSGERSRSTPAPAMSVGRAVDRVAGSGMYWCACAKVATWSSSSPGGRSASNLLDTNQKGVRLRISTGPQVNRAVKRCRLHRIGGMGDLRPVVDRHQSARGVEAMRGYHRVLDLLQASPASRPRRR